MIYSDPQVLQAQALYAGLASLILEKVKESKLIPAVNFDTDTLNKWIAILMAGVTAAGISVKYSYSTDGLFTLQIANLTFWGIFDSLKNWAWQYGMQQLIYKNVIKKPKTIVDIVGQEIQK